MASALALAAPAAAPQATVVVPFEYEDARVYVPVTAGAMPPQWFVLDTGAEPTVVDVGLASRLRARVRDVGTVGGAGTGRLSQGWAEGVRLTVGGAPLAPPRTAVSAIDSLLSPFTGRHAAGIVGSQFFREHVVALDFGTRTARLLPPAAFTYAGRGVVLPVHLVGGVPIADGVLTVPDGRRLPLRLLVDLGAKATLLVSEPFVERHRLRAAFPVAVRSPLGAGVGGETRYDFVRVPRLEVGGGQGAVADSVLAGLSADGTLRATWYDALLGAEFLERFHVVFDYARGRVILEPRAPAVPPAAFDMSGAFFVARAPDLRRFAVHAVAPGSPAAAAGLRPGDVLRTANGRRAADYTLGALRQLLRSGDGRSVPLEVERDGRMVAVTLRLRRLV